MDNSYPLRIIIQKAVRLQSKNKGIELRVEQMVKRLREADYRITPQRMAILKVLAGNSSHPSAEDIHGDLLALYPTMSLATVYKTIALLKKQGEVLELQFSELGNRYDGNIPYPHPHVICTSCGEIVDPSMLDLKDITEKMMKETGFEIVSHRLDFFGFCSECQAKE